MEILSNKTHLFLLIFGCTVVLGLYLGMAGKGQINRNNDKGNFISKPELSWEEFDELIRNRNLKWENGKSFNGSTILEISQRVSNSSYNGSYTTVVFVNHLDQEIDNFTMYNPLLIPKSFVSSSVPPHTAEIFTFADPTQADVWLCFSYNIPSSGKRIAAMSINGAGGVGLAFLPEGSKMENYFYSPKGVEPFQVYQKGEETEDRWLSVGYKNFHARMFADAKEGGKETTLTIELISLN